MKKSLVILAALSSIFFVNCSNNTEDPAPDNDAVLRKEVLTDVSSSVITETYKKLYDNAVLLKVAADAFSIGDETKLTNLKNAWIATRTPWECSEGFLYGPVDTKGIDPAIDSWPVDVTAINNIIASPAPITSNVLESNNEARGFHALEYFIWGLNNNKTASQFTPREVEFIVAASQNLKEKTLELYNGWLGSQGNFVNNFINAGTPGTVYVSQKDALKEIAEGLVIIADEVANGKIEEPLNGNAGAAKQEAEESRFSNNSKLDFANNIRSIQNIYLGDYNGFERKGLSDIVSKTNSALDNNIKFKITAAILAIEAIPGTFTNAIVNNRPAVQNAQVKVSELKVLLDTQLIPFISNL